jgi:hemerythrin-like metal-binding protein
MPLTEWNDSYELGIKELDDHHRQLVELLNKAYNQILYSTDKDDIHPILQELIKYSDYHFAAEEQMMRDIGYKGVKSHITKHNNFKKQLTSLMNSEEPHVNTDIVLFLWDWLIKHILKDDKKLLVCVSP